METIEDYLEGLPASQGLKQAIVKLLDDWEERADLKIDNLEVYWSGTQRMIDVTVCPPNAEEKTVYRIRG